MGCSRETPRCSRCTDADINCVYSRHGKIRRNIKNGRSSSTLYESASSQSSNVRTDHREQSVSSNAALPAIAPTTAISPGVTAQERLEQFSGSSAHHPVFAKLGSLLEEYRAGLRSSSPFDVLTDDPVKDCLLLENEAEVSTWVDTMLSVLELEHCMLLPIPDHILQALRASEPRRVDDRAWLIIFYTIALEHVSQKESLDEVKSAMLRKNLWWAFNDVRLFLKPTIVGVHALLLMMQHAEQYLTPSICWSLLSKACSMMQTLESDQWREPGSVSEPRTVLFWRLNLLDKSLALALNRVPSIAGSVAFNKPLPSLQQFMTPINTQIPKLFQAHFGRQMAQLSLLMGEVWECAHGQRFESSRVRKSLEAWHTQASQGATDIGAKVLEAAALAERPLLAQSDIDTPTLFDIGLNTIHCQYHFVAVFLTVPSSEQQPSSETLRGPMASRRMLDFLPKLTGMASHLKGPFAPDLCQLLQCPITSFGTLWAHSMSMLRFDKNESRLALDAMANAPYFFSQFSSRNIFAVKMMSTTEQIIEYSRLLLSPQEQDNTSHDKRQTQSNQQRHEMTHQTTPRSAKEATESSALWADNAIPEEFWGADWDEWLAEMNGNLFDSTAGFQQW
nr:putative transcriptional regulatory protein c11d3.07c [Quercus suber]